MIIKDKTKQYKLINIKMRSDKNNCYENQKKIPYNNCIVLVHY